MSCPLDDGSGGERPGSRDRQSGAGQSRPAACESRAGRSRSHPGVVAASGRARYRRKGRRIDRESSNRRDHASRQGSAASGAASTASSRQSGRRCQHRHHLDDHNHHRIAHHHSHRCYRGLRRFAQCLAIAVVLVAAARPVSSAPGQAPSSELHLLDVPYLPQSEALCGGAAIAMLMRYWGTPNVYAETFANLVDATAAGIHGGDLVAALRSRGYDAESIRGTRDQVQARLAARQPVVALIEDRPKRFHYVVIVGWAERHVIVHDPARAPFRILDERTFLKAWTASERWTLIASPPSPARSITDDADRSSAADRSPRRSPDQPCGDLMNEGIRLAGADDVTGARRLFELAATRCPDAAGPWREMAGLHALAAEWPAAASDARRALAKDSSDALAARILATSLFLEDDVNGALDAWNRVGEPIIDLISVTGLERMRYQVAARVMGFETQTLLTAKDLIAARRRFAELPAAQVTRVSMRPGENGRAQIDASIIERPLVPSSPIALTAVGLRALTDREAVITIANPS